MHMIKFILLSLTLLLSSAVQAAEEAGKILFARGVVSIIDENDSRRGARTGASVFEGERVVTGNGGIAQLYLNDGSLLGLRGNTDYHIKRQRYDEDAGVAEQAGELLSGWMRFITGAIGKTSPANVSVTTSVATIGIRGTVFQVLHVPEEGLADFADAEPGSYLYLEDGVVDMSSAAGSQRLNSGEVAWVGLAGAAPMPSPERRLLFMRDHVGQAYRENARDHKLMTARLLKLRNELRVEGALEQFVADQVADSLFVKVGGLSLFSPEGSLSSFRSGPDNLQYADLVGQRIQLAGRGPSAVGDGSFDAVLFKPGAQPLSVGSAVLGGVSQVHWGIWREGSYQAFNTSTGEYTGTGDWHYVMGSFAVSDPVDLASRLNGTFRYRYVGGTLLGKDSGIAAGDLSSFGRVLGGQLIVDFGSNTLEADLGVNLPTTGNVAISGTGSIGQFYGDGFGLADGTATVTGNIQGMFTGPNGEGAISTVTVNDINTNSNYGGVAVFENAGTSSVIVGP